MSTGADDDRIVVAQFGAAHGIRGEVRLKSFTQDPLSVGAYGPLETEDGRAFIIRSMRPAAGTAPDMLVVAVEGVTTRDQAEGLNGLELSMPRSRLPQAEAEEFYHADLVGLEVAMKDGTVAGVVVAVRNFGAGDLVEVAPRRGASFLVPFTRDAVPEIDLVGGRIVIDPLPGLLGGETDEDAP